jgi:hypothetical protein
MALIDLGAPDMVLWRTSHAFTQDVVHLLQDMARVMQSVGSPDDLTHSDLPSHISWTLDDGQMSPHFADMVILVDRWAGSPHFWTVYPQHDSTWFEDVALDDDWAPLGEVMSPFSPWTMSLFTLDIELLDDDVMHYVLLDDDGGAIGAPFMALVDDMT